MPQTDAPRDTLARAICEGLGYDWSALYADKREWTDDRGARGDINMPMKRDCYDAADAVLARYTVQPCDGGITDTERIEQIQRRVDAVGRRRWHYNPEYEMFVGTTNALEMYGDVIDLGRNHEEWRETGHGYKLTEASVEQMARVKALGEFLEHCREDIRFLLAAIAAERRER